MHSIKIVALYLSDHHPLLLVQKNITLGFMVLQMVAFFPGTTKEIWQNVNYLCTYFFLHFKDKNALAAALELMH